MVSLSNISVNDSPHDRRFLFGVIESERINRTVTMFRLNQRPHRVTSFSIDWTETLPQKVVDFLECLVCLQIISAADCKRIVNHAQSNSGLQKRICESKKLEELESLLFGHNCLCSLTDDANFTNMIYKAFAFTSLFEMLAYAFNNNKTKHLMKITKVYNQIREIALNVILGYLNSGEMNTASVSKAISINISSLAEIFEPAMMQREVVDCDNISGTIDRELRSAMVLTEGIYGINRTNYITGGENKDRLELVQPKLSLKGTDIKFKIAGLGNQEIRLLKAGKCPFFTLSNIDENCAYAKWLAEGYS